MRVDLSGHEARRPAARAATLRRRATSLVGSRARLAFADSALGSWGRGRLHQRSSPRSATSRSGPRLRCPLGGRSSRAPRRSAPSRRAVRSVGAAERGLRATRGATDRNRCAAALRRETIWRRFNCRACWPFTPVNVESTRARSYILMRSSRQPTRAAIGAAERRSTGGQKSAKSAAAATPANAAGASPSDAPPLRPRAAWRRRAPRAPGVRAARLDAHAAALDGEQLSQRARGSPSAFAHVGEPSKASSTREPKRYSVAPRYAAPGRRSSWPRCPRGRRGASVTRTVKSATRKRCPDAGRGCRGA